ncbi:MAG: multiheme c-type cytochrome [Gemmataceae bacterium]
MHAATEKNSPSTTPGLEQSAPAASAMPVTSRGMQSCAAAACHGNPNPLSLTDAPGRDCWQSSHTHFSLVDPHRKSFDVLKSELSQRITKALRKSSPVPIPDAFEDARCLACHTNPSLAYDTISAESKNLRKEGVTCEACHGPAGDWLANHTTWTPANRAREIQSVHFRDLNQLETRAKNCAGCHVGSPANGDGPVRDMNHDMIAAGHPALDKKIEDLVARLPRHWQEKDRSQAGTPARPTKGMEREYEAFKTFTKALDTLSNDRKQRNDPARTPQPELSEQSCILCHHSLKP